MIFLSTVESILLKDWDPIGIQALTEAADEYNRYAPIVCDMIKNNKSATEIYQYLNSVEIERMGLSGSSPNTAVVSRKLAKLGNST